MKKILFFLLGFLIFQSCKQTKIEYLQKNRIDVLSTDFDFPQRNFKIIGFGAYHGSAKTEEAEYVLLKSLTKDGTIKYYLPETDFSIAHYFNEYLQNGDTILLKDLVTQYGRRVPQERTIEIYQKWKNIKRINDQLPEKNKITVVGIDFQVSYKYTSRHILELLDGSLNQRAPIKKIKQMVETDTTNYSLGDLSYACKVLKDFVNDYENNKSLYEKHIEKKADFRHIIKNLQRSFDKKAEREKTMFDNYLALDSIYDFRHNPQFLRMGFSHLEKSREGNKGYPYFFTRLIENKVYTRDKVLSMIGYFTDSKVIWDELYDDNGNYLDFTTEGGMGIGDYEKEYFRGIKKLKDTKISDITLFRLNKKNSPYLDSEPDLIEVIMKDEKSNGEYVKGMSTLKFLDYAILISNSKASTPIFEMDKNN